jgi:glycerophosphoryl diester phosphodiesterase
MTPLVIAHRGACWRAPENTLAAFELAIEEGADYVEFDVRAARDGTLVLCHDAVPAPRPAEMPTLDETLEALRGRVGIAVEIKEARATLAVLDALARHRVEADDLLLLSFRVRALEEARRRRPELRSLLHLGRRPDPTAGARFWGVGFDNRAARPRAIALAQSLGLATAVFTVNEPARMLELASLGVTGIFSDRPRLLRETLARGEGRAPAPSPRGSTR